MTDKKIQINVRFLDVFATVFYGLVSLAILTPILAVIGFILTFMLAAFGVVVLGGNK